MKDVIDRKTSGRNILWAISNAAAANGDYELFLIDYSLGVVSETGVDVCRYVRQSDRLNCYFISVPFILGVNSLIASKSLALSIGLLNTLLKPAS